MTYLAKITLSLTAFSHYDVKRNRGFFCMGRLSHACYCFVGFDKVSDTQEIWEASPTVCFLNDHNRPSALEVMLFFYYEDIS